MVRAELLSHSSCSSLKEIPSDSSTSGTSLSLDDARQLFKGPLVLPLKVSTSVSQAFTTHQRCCQTSALVSINISKSTSASARMSTSRNSLSLDDANYFKIH